MAKTAKRRQIQTVDDKPAVNKSQSIRDYLASHAGAKPKEVVDALAAQDVAVSPNMVSMIKAKQGIKKARAEKMPSVSNLDHVVTLYRAAKGKPVGQDAINAAFAALYESLS